MSLEAVGLFSQLGMDALEFNGTILFSAAAFGGDSYVSALQFHVIGRFTPHSPCDVAGYREKLGMNTTPKFWPSLDP